MPDLPPLGELVVAIGDHLRHLGNLSLQAVIFRLNPGRIRLPLDLHARYHRGQNLIVEDANGVVDDQRLGTGLWNRKLCLWVVGCVEIGIVQALSIGARNLCPQRLRVIDKGNFMVADDTVEFERVEANGHRVMKAREIEPQFLSTAEAHRAERLHSLTALGKAILPAFLHETLRMKRIARRTVKMRLPLFCQCRIDWHEAKDVLKGSAVGILQQKAANGARRDRRRCLRNARMCDIRHGIAFGNNGAANSCRHAMKGIAREEVDVRAVEKADIRVFELSRHQAQKNRIVRDVRHRDKNAARFLQKLF